MKKFFAKVKAVLEGKRGEGYIDTAVKMIIAVVIGALLLGGLYFIFNDMILPGLAERIQDMFGSPGAGGNKRLIDLIKKYLKSGVMENGIVMKTEEGSPQGGNLSPLLANIYLDKFDKEFEGRGVKVIRYADDIILLAKSIRAAERLLGTSTAYLEKKLKLKVNTEKSRAVSVYSIRNFGFLVLRWEGTGEVPISEFTAKPRRKPKRN